MSEHEDDLLEGFDVGGDAALDAEATGLEPEEDGFRHIQLRIRRMFESRRLDKYLSGRLGKDVSRTSLQRYIREGDVTVGGRIVKPSYIIRPGDTIDLSLPVVKPREIPPEAIPLDVIYEDGDLIALNKQADLIIHPARGNWSGTLVNALAYYFQGGEREIGELPTGGEACRPGVVHRLDRDTTGVILVAKSELALWRLGRMFENRRVQKTYWAIVHGSLGLDEDVIDLPIGKHPKIREKHAVHRKTGLAYPSTTKEAVTRYRVLQRMHCQRCRASFSLVELYPKTGRTHQLRVHMSHLGHPIIGDKTYGGGPLYRSQLEGRPESAEGPLITRQALHARRIEFEHPRTSEPMRIEAPPPADFVAALEALEALAKEE